MKELTIEEIEHARVCVLENAKSLYKEASLLESHGHYARAYTLAHICHEELSKLPMLVGVGMDLINGDSINWKKLNKRLTSHIEKLDFMHMQAYMKSEIRADDSDVRAFEEALSSTPKLNENKNNSLYAGVINNKFKQPNELFNQPEVQTILRQVSDRLENFILSESKTIGKISDSKVALKHRKELKKYFNK